MSDHAITVSLTASQESVLVRMVAYYNSVNGTSTTNDQVVKDISEKYIKGILERYETNEVNTWKLMGLPS